MGSLFSASGQIDTPLHAGEAMALWTYAVALDEGRSLCLFLLNQTEDPDLRRMLEHYIHALEEPQSKRLHLFMREEGLSLPPVTPDKGKANVNEIPLGAKLTDSEVANMFLLKIIAGMNIASGALVQSIRPDVGAMFYAFFNELLKEGFTVKQTMQKRGWLKVPPAFHTGKLTHA